MRARIASVLDWAKAAGYRAGDNPASWEIIGKLLPSRAKIAREEHHPAVPYAEMPAFMEQLRACEGVIARALETAILTAARTGEVLGARWEEFDLPAKLWTVPAQRMKGGKEHRVPLSPRVLDILHALPREREEGLVFVGARPEAQ